MNQKQYNSWSKLRQHGENRFIWVRGVVIWGFSTAILWSILMQLLTPTDEFMRRTIIALVVFSVGGYFWGKLVWKANEKKHAQYQDAQHAD